LRAQHHEAVLLVEDEHLVRLTAARILGRLGYRVTDCANAAEALAAAPAAAPRILITDVDMPGLSGRELAARLRAARPGLLVLFTSGYTEEAFGEEALAEPGVGFLAKPYTAETLGAKVREMLDREA
jgi:CheY-like chemotaxis protein